MCLFFEFSKFTFPGVVIVFDRACTQRKKASIRGEKFHSPARIGELTSGSGE